MIWVIGERSNPTGRRSASDTQARLAALLGVDRDEMMRRVLWLNLFEYPGTTPELYVRMVEESIDKGDSVLLLGRRVQRAFGLALPSPMTVISRSSGAKIVSVPHPSGLNRWWNDPDHVEDATMILRAVWGGTSR